MNIPVKIEVTTIIANQYSTISREGKARETTMSCSNTYIMSTKDRLILGYIGDETRSTV